MIGAFLQKAGTDLTTKKKACTESITTEQSLIEYRRNLAKKILDEQWTQTPNIAVVQHIVQVLSPQIVIYPTHYSTPELRRLAQDVARTYMYSGLNEDSKRLQKLESELQGLKKDLESLRASEANLNEMIRTVPSPSQPDGKKTCVPQTRPLTPVTTENYAPPQEGLGEKLRQTLPKGVKMERTTYGGKQITVREGENPFWTATIDGREKIFTRNPYGEFNEYKEPKTRSTAGSIQ